jgi:hypothetical protein
LRDFCFGGAAPVLLLPLLSLLSLLLLLSLSLSLLSYPCCDVMQMMVNSVNQVRLSWS